MIFRYYDLRIQQYALNLLKEHKAGSLYLWILTMEHIYVWFNPSYNPNKIIQKPNKEYWDSILENELSPLTLDVFKVYMPQAQLLKWLLP